MRKLGEKASPRGWLGCFIMPPTTEPGSWEAMGGVVRAGGERSQHRACCTFGVWWGWREKEELLSKYRNIIPAGKGTGIPPAATPGCHPCARCSDPQPGQDTSWAPTLPTTPSFWSWPGTAKPQPSPTLYSFPPPYSKHPPRCSRGATPESEQTFSHG